MVPQYEFVEHTADIRVHGFGDSLQGLYINCALAMMEILFGPAIFERESEKEVLLSASASSREELLVEWLSRLHYLSNTSYCACVRFGFDGFSDTRLSARVGVCQAVAIDDIKAVTHHDLRIRNQDGKWEAMITFDI